MTSNRRVLVVAPFYRYFVKGIVDAIAKQTSEVNVFIPHNRLAEIAKYLPSAGYISHVRNFTSDRLVDPMEKPSNVRIHLVNMFYLTPDARNVRIGDKLANKIKSIVEHEKTSADLLIGYFTWPCGYACLRLPNHNAAPTVLMLGESQDWIDQMRYSRNWRFVWTWKNIGTIVRGNRVDVPLMKRYNEHVISVLGGYDQRFFFPMDRITARTNIGFDTSGQIIFCMGELEKRKGVEFLIESMPGLLQSKQRLTCIIAGNGPDLERLKARTKQLDIERHVFFVGRVPFWKTCSYYNAADIFVLPTLSEGTPNVMYESLSLRYPLRRKFCWRNTRDNNLRRLWISCLSKEYRSIRRRDSYGIE